MMIFMRFFEVGKKAISGREYGFLPTLKKRKKAQKDSINEYFKGD
jgi:hypothetical protein